MEAYRSLAEHLYDTPEVIKSVPFWNLHRAIDFYSVVHSRTGEKVYKERAERLVRVLGQTSLHTLELSSGRE